MGIMAFTPMGNTVSFTAATSVPAPAQALSTTVGGTQYRIYNSGNATVFIGFGNTTANAIAMANTSLNGPTIVMVPQSVEVFTLNANQYFTGITTVNSSVVYVTPGDGA